MWDCYGQRGRGEDEVRTIGGGGDRGMIVAGPVGGGGRRGRWRGRSGCSGGVMKNEVILRVVLWSFFLLRRRAGCWAGVDLGFDLGGPSPRSLVG